MKQKLYSNTKHFTGVFLASIICVTLAVLLTRLVLLPNMATTTPQPAVDSIVRGTTPFLYSYNSAVYFPSPTIEGDIMVENPEDSDYYIIAEIFDPATLDSYLYTGFIEPGVTIDRNRLQQDIDEGVHEFAIRLTAYDRDSLEQLHSIERPISLNIGQRP